jgi:hypothetical protein
LIGTYGSDAVEAKFTLPVVAAIEFAVTLEEEFRILREYTIDNNAIRRGGARKEPLPNAHDGAVAAIVSVTVI